MTHQELVNRKEHYENVLREIKLNISRCFMRDEQPPLILLQQEQEAKRLIAEAESNLSAIDWILNN